MTDWKSQRTQALVFGTGSILVGLVLGWELGTVGWGGRGYTLPPSPLAGVIVAVLGVIAGLLAFRFALRHPSRLR